MSWAYEIVLDFALAFLGLGKQVEELSDNVWSVPGGGSDSIVLKPRARMDSPFTWWSPSQKLSREVKDRFASYQCFTKRAECIWNTYCVCLGPGGFKMPAIPKYVRQNPLFVTATKWKLPTTPINSGIWAALEGVSTGCMQQHSWTLAIVLKGRWQRGRSPSYLICFVKSTDKGETGYSG